MNTKQVIKTVTYKGFDYTREQINEMRTWVSECSWTDEVDADELSDIEVLRGVDKHVSGGLAEFINCI